MPEDDRTPRSATFALLGAYVFGRLWQLAMLGTPVLTPDTSGYRLPGRAGLFDLDLVSLTGHALRPWPLTLLYAIGPNDAARVLLQMGVGTLAWATLAVAIGTHSRRHLVAAAAVLALALSPGVSGWDAVLLGESLLVSATAFAVAGFVFLRQGRRLPGLLFSVGATAFLVISRPVFAPLALLLALLVVLLKPKDRRSRAGYAVLAAALMLTTGHAYLVNVEIDRQWGRETGEPDLRGRTVQQFSILAWSAQGPELIDRMIDDGAPACLAPPVERTTGAWEWWQAKRVDCPHGLRWAGDHFTGWLVRHLATHPADARDYFRMALASASHERADGAVALPSPTVPLVSNLFYGNSASDALVGLGLAVMGFGVFRRRWPAWPLIGLVAAGVVALFLTAILSALDIARVGLSAAVLVRLGLVLCCLDIADRAQSSPSRAVALTTPHRRRGPGGHG